MARNMTTFIKDRTLADVQRVKELLAKKYQNMTATEQAEWDGYMKGRFTYQDWNRLGSYVNMVKDNLNAVYYWINHSTILSTNTIYTASIDTIPGSAGYTNFNIYTLFYYIDYTLRYLGFNGISLRDYSYNKFNELEDKTDFLDNYIEIYNTESQTTPTYIAINNTTYGNDPRISLNDYVATADVNYKVKIHSLLLPIRYGTYIFQKATIVDLSECWFLDTLNSADLTKNTMNNFFANNTTIKKLILPTDKDIEIKYPFGKTSVSYPVYEEINTEKIAYLYNRTGTTAGVFENCRRLTKVDFSGLKDTLLPSNALRYCISLTKLILPSTLTQIGGSAISYCGSLKEITFLGTMTQWNNISKVAGWNTGTSLERIVCTDGIINI